MSDLPIKVEISDEYDPAIPNILPHERIFSIHVGYKLFRLSGASLSSDAPSYFTRFFSQEENDGKTLFIDRNPVIFEKIYNHLQGYPINVEDDYEFAHLWSDSYYFELRYLQNFLREDVFATVGNKSFKIARSLFINTGNFPNYFTINHDTLLSNNPKMIEENNMIRPPPLRPVSVSNRSPVLLADLLELLKGNHLVIKNDEHRHLLIRECRYYRFLELEQRIIRHKIINNPFLQNRQEIIIDLMDLQYKGLSNGSKDTSIELPIQYTRPYLIKEPKRSLIFQMDSNTCDLYNKNYSEVKLILNKSNQLVLVQITNKLCLKFAQVFKDYSDEAVFDNLKADIPSITLLAGLYDCKAVINGMEMKRSWVTDLLGGPNQIESVSIEKNVEDDKSPETKKRRLDSQNILGDIIEFKLTKSLWRLMLRKNLPRLQAISIEGLTDQNSFIKETIDFL